MYKVALWKQEKYNCEYKMQIKYRKVRLRVQDVEQQSAITSTGSAGVLRHLPPPVAQNGSTGKREGGSVWHGCLLFVWLSFIGMVLLLVWLSSIVLVLYHFHCFAQFVMGLYYWFGIVPLIWFFVLHCILHKVLKERREAALQSFSISRVHFCCRLK